MDITSKIDAKYHNELDIVTFSRLFKTTNQSYKYYWFEAIVKRIIRNQQVISFDDLVEDMICEAWHTVNEYHLHLGRISSLGNDNFIEQAIAKLYELSGLSSTANYRDIKRVIDDYENEILDQKNKLYRHVPYRLMQPFISELKVTDSVFGQAPKITSIINDYAKKKDILYTFDERDGEKVIVLSPNWMQMIKENAAIILGWIQHEKVKYLEKKNPGVPGIASKLSGGGSDRKLRSVRNFWSQIMEHEIVVDLYSDTVLNQQPFSVDHFIPWSYVASDEVWNLIPTTQGMNSSKGNKLPNWDEYMGEFTHRQYVAYTLIHEYQDVYKKFDICRRNNLNAIWAESQLYKPGNDETEFINILTANMKPIYNAAKIQGFEMWIQ